MSEFTDELSSRLTTLQESGQLRSLTTVEHLPGGNIRVAGREYVNLAGNDYLGLASNAAFCAAFYAERYAENRLSSQALGSTASRLMTGNVPACAKLEAELARFYGREAALFFNSGYHANLGILPALAGKDDLILADKLCHASLIDGMRLSRAKVLRYPHLDYEAVERLFTRERGNFRHAFLVSESVFSMDGDCADLPELVRLKDKWNAILYVDEAHSVGIRGERGLGLAEEQGVLADIDLFVGTCGKAYGGMGAFVTARRVIIDYLVNTARPQIFSTGLPPINVEWLRFVLKRLPELSAVRKRVAEMADQLRAGLRAQGLQTGGESNIVPVILGDARRTVAVARFVREAGYWVSAVRPPTVPQGTSRFRLSLNASMNRENLEPLPGLIAAALEKG